MKSIPAAKVYFPEEDLKDLAVRLTEILRSGRLVLGPYTERFEREFAASHGRKFGIAVNSGTSALEIILRALRIRGGEVIIPTNTFAATAFAVLHSENQPVLADVTRRLALGPDEVEQRMTNRTRAVIVVHIGGRILPETTRLETLCREKGIPLIEDAAHAHGSRLADRAAGTFGVAAGFSFYPTKVITSCEGGMILTDDEELAARCRVFRDQGKAGFAQNLHTEIGYNWRMSELHACIGLAQLGRLSEFIRNRRSVAHFYDRQLQDTSIRPLLEEAGMFSNYYKYVAMLPDGATRSRIKERLKEDFGISLSGEVYETPLHEQPVFRALWGESPAFPVAEDVCRRHICLPLYASMDPDDATRVTDSLREILG